MIHNYDLPALVRAGQRRINDDAREVHARTGAVVGGLHFQFALEGPPVALSLQK